MDLTYAERLRSITQQLRFLAGEATDPTALDDIRASVVALFTDMQADLDAQTSAEEAT